jgi:hypothetical protein
VSAPRIVIEPARVLKAYKDSHSARSMAQLLGVSHGTTAQRMARDAGLDVPAGHWGPKAGVVAAPDLPPEEAHAHDLEVQRLKDDLTTLRRKYNVACKHENLYQDVLDVAREVMSKTPPAKVLPPRIGKGDTNEDAILTWADWHGGEIGRAHV